MSRGRRHGPSKSRLHSVGRLPKALSYPGRRPQFLPVTTIDAAADWVVRIVATVIVAEGCDEASAPPVLAARCDRHRPAGRPADRFCRKLSRAGGTHFLLF